jgi:hypothetical protein
MSAEKWHLLSIGLANLGLVLGILAAWYWWRASRVAIIPLWGAREPVDQSQALAGWIVGINEAAEVSGKLNTIAALLSGAAVLVSTLAGWVGSLS